MMKFAVFLVICVALMETIPVDAAIYTRWGRTICDGDATVVYTGYMATESNGFAGSGRNYLCVSDNPDWGNVDATFKTYYAGIHGVQYWFGPGYTNNNPFSYANYNGQDIYQHAAPCVSCSSPRSEIVMIPGKMRCPGDMFVEYSGYIVANHWSNYGSEYVCLDQAPEVAKAGGTFTSDGVLVIGQIMCGTLPCPHPYSQYNQVSCAVCTA